MSPAVLSRACLMLALVAVPLAPLLPLPGAPLPQKQLLLLALAGAGSLLVWWQARRGAELPALGTPVDGTLALWVGAVLLAALAAARPGLAAYGASLPLASLMLYVLAIKSLRRAAHVRALYAAVFGVALVVSVSCLAGYARFLADGAPEVARSGYLANAIFPHSYLGAQYLAMVFVGGAVLVLEPGGTRRRWRPLAAIGLLPMAAALFVIGSRGAWLAVLLALGVSTLLRTSAHDARTGARHTRRRLLRLAWHAGVALGVMTLLGLALSLTGTLAGAGDYAFERLAMLFDPQRVQFNYSRLDVWRDSLDMVAEHVLLGVGPGHFETSFPPYHTSDHSVPHAHNQLMQLLSETGSVGLAAFLLLLVQARRAALRGAALLAPDGERRGPFHAALAALLAGALYFLWETPLQWAETGSLMVVLLAILSRAGCSSRDAVTRAPVAHAGGLAVLLALALTLPATVDFLSATRAAAQAHAAETQAALAADPTAQLEHQRQAVAAIERADAAFPYGADFLAWRARVLTRMRQTEEALQAWREADARAPGTFEANSAIGSLLLRLGRPAEAVAPLRTAVIAHLGAEAAPTYMRLATAYKRAGQFEEAWTCYLTLVGYFHFETVEPAVLLDAASVLVSLQRLPLFADRLLIMHAGLVPDSEQDPVVIGLREQVQALRTRGPRVLGD